MRRTLILCEGADDRAALREIVGRNFGFSKSSTAASRNETFALGDATLEFVVAGDKERVLRLASEALLANSPSHPVMRLGLSFDPNGHVETDWRRWIEAGLAHALVRADAAEHGFFSQVFGQHPPTRDLLAAQLPGSPLGEALALLLT